VRDWLAALDELLALAALATLSAENPEWALPAIADDGAPAVVEARALAHPLLPATSRVANDVVVGPPGSVLLVTGSNMSGKSTLLRAIGANVLLARAGGAVCASSLRLPVLDVRTSIRIADSLERGVSLFMAELRRLKEVVDVARAHPGGRPLLYLLDEILHGTNTAERRIAARTVIGHLLDAGAIGVVTTHDLTLAADGPLRDASRPVHFTEHFERVDGVMRMTFDYRLRPGLATSTNALALLELVGLGGGSTTH
jgi:DNA mismatch repair ATPase MutS